MESNDSMLFDGNNAEPTLREMITRNEKLEMRNEKGEVPTSCLALHDSSKPLHALEMSTRKRYFDYLVIQTRERKSEPSV